MSSLCRLALLLSGADARDLRVLPDDLPATLLLFRPPTSRRSLESLGALGWPGFRNCRQNRLVETVGAKAIVSDTPLPDNQALGPTFVAHVVASQRPLPPVDKKTLEALAKEFLPQLLRYRLQRCTTVVEESVHTDPASPPSSLVTALEICFRDEPALLEAVSALIDAAQNGHKPGHADPRVPVLEALRARCHEVGRNKVYVAEIALDLNTQIFASDGKLEVSNRMVGNILRSLGLATRRLDRRGRGLLLDGPTKQRIHQLARVHDAPAARQPFPGCADCAQAQSPAT